MKTIGQLLITFGVAIVFFAFFKKTFIEEEGSYGLIRQTINIGLVADREMIHISGWFTILIGAIFTAASAIKESISQQRFLLENTINSKLVEMSNKNNNTP